MTDDKREYEKCVNCGHNVGYWFGKPIKMTMEERKKISKDALVCAFAKNNPVHVKTINWKDRTFSFLPCNKCPECGCIEPKIECGDSK